MPDSQQRAARSDGQAGAGEQRPAGEAARSGGSGGPVGSGEYVVQEGDCISSIAVAHGHFWKRVWEDAANAEVREARGDPNILLPGDRLHIPEKQPKQEPGATEKRHRFRRRGEPAHLRLQILRDGEPRADTPYRLETDTGRSQEGTLDADGRLDVPIPGGARRATLYVGAPDGGEPVDEYPIQLGGTDPETEVRGIQERLRNLGFDCPVDGRESPEMESAVRAFQIREGLEADGRIDRETHNVIVARHGS